MNSGRILGYLCGYMGRGFNPAVLGYHQGYLAKTAKAPNTDSGIQEDSKVSTDKSGRGGDNSVVPGSLDNEEAAVQAPKQQPWMVGSPESFPRSTGWGPKAPQQPTQVVMR